MSEIAFREDAHRRLVAQGRSILKTTLPDVDFDAHVWDLADLRKKRTGVSSRVHWTRHGTTDEPLPVHFIEAVKAAVAITMKSPTNSKFKSDAARFLWKSLEDRGVFESFRWETAIEQDMLQMEQTMLETLAKSSVNKTCGAFSALLETLHLWEVISPMKVSWVTPRPEDSERHTLAGQEKRREMLPSLEALEALGDLYRSRKELDEMDRLMLCIVGIMVATGLRIGEVLTLPRNCLFYIGNGSLGSRRYFGLRYWPEKGGDERDQDVAWIPARAGRLVLSMVREVRGITASASTQAKLIVEAQQHTGLFPLPPGFAMRLHLTCEEVARALGLAKSTSATASVRAIGILSERDVHGRQEYFVDPEDLRAYLNRRQVVTSHVTSKRRVRQRLDSALFVTHLNQLHATKGTNPLLVSPVRIQVVNDALGGRWQRANADEPGAVQRGDEFWVCLVKSIFARHGYLERDGSAIELTTHMIRHWLVTEASGGGANDALLARWQNRRHVEDLNAYKHLTTEHRVEALRRALHEGTLGGEIAEAYFNLAEDLREAFLDAQVQHVHVTDVGLCIHDFSRAPCPHHLNCLKGCSDFVTDRSDPVQNQQLVQLQMRTKDVLEAELAQAEVEGHELSENWIDEHQTVLTNLERIIQIEGEGLVRPFHGERSQFQPMEDSRRG